MELYLKQARTITLADRNRNSFWGTAVQRSISVRSSPIPYHAF